MGKDRKWTCEKIVKKFHSVSELEIEQRLAELWDVLVQGNGQFNRSQVLVPVKSQSPLLNSKRRAR
jgi:hypothetical protein